MPPIFLSAFPKEGLVCNVHVDGPWNVRLPLLCWVALKSQGQGPCPLWHLDPLICWLCFPSFCQCHLNTFSPNTVKMCIIAPTEPSQMDKKFPQDPAGVMATKGQKTSCFPAVFPRSYPAQTSVHSRKHCSFKMGRGVTSYTFYIISCGTSL